MSEWKDTESSVVDCRTQSRSIADVATPDPKVYPSDSFRGIRRPRSHENFLDVIGPDCSHRTSDKDSYLLPICPMRAQQSKTSLRSEPDQKPSPLSTLNVFSKQKSFDVHGLCPRISTLQAKEGSSRSPKSFEVQTEATVAIKKYLQSTFYHAGQSASTVWNSRDDLTVVVQKRIHSELEARPRPLEVSAAHILPP